MITFRRLIPYAVALLAAAGLVSAPGGVASYLRKGNREAELVAALRDARDGGERIRAAEALGAHGPSSVPRLVELLQRADDPLTRRGVCYALIRLGPEGKAALGALVEVVESPDDPVREEAMVVIERMGPVATAATTVLGEVLAREASPALREGAARALVRIGPASVPVLRELLVRGTEPQQVAAAEALAELGPAARYAREDLVRCGLESSSQVSELCFLALGRIGELAAAPLAEALADERLEVRRRAAAALNRLDATAARRASLALREALGDPDRIVRYLAVRRLTHLGAGAGDAVGELCQAVHDPDDDIRWQVAAALGNVAVASQAARTALLGLARDPEPAVRLRAAVSLAATGDSAAAQRLLEALRHDPSDRLNREADAVLRRLQRDFKDSRSKPRGRNGVER